MARNPLFFLPLSTLVLLAGCAPDEAASGVRFNLCESLVVAPDANATPEQLGSIDQAMAFWNQLAGARLSLASSAGAGAATLPLHFQSAAGNFHGLYDAPTAQVFINLDLAGHQLAVTVAHEIGHSYGLVHVSSDQRASVMNPGNLTVEPNASDAAALAAIWGACPAPAGN